MGSLVSTKVKLGNSLGLSESRKATWGNRKDSWASKRAKLVKFPCCSEMLVSMMEMLVNNSDLLASMKEMWGNNSD